MRYLPSSPMIQELWAAGLRHTGRMGPMEKSVQSDLKRLPAEMRDGGIAQIALFAARQLDGAGDAELPHRDAAAYLAQMRHCLVQLRDWAPGEVKDDPTDTARKNREARMLHLA
jgi:hypothetical protein